LVVFGQKCGKEKVKKIYKRLKKVGCFREAKAGFADLCCQIGKGWNESEKRTDLEVLNSFLSGYNIDDYGRVWCSELGKCSTDVVKDERNGGKRRSVLAAS
jgi:hypothetical protein